MKIRPWEDGIITGVDKSTVPLAVTDQFVLGRCKLILPNFSMFSLLWSPSVAQLDARSTGDQEFAVSIPRRVDNILSWRLIMKYFLRSFSPFR